MLRRKAVKDTRERWFGTGIVASSAGGEAAPCTPVRISDVVEMGDVQYVEEHLKHCLPCCSRSFSSPGSSKKRRMPESPVAAQREFSVESPSDSRPSFAVALEKSFEKLDAIRSGRECWKAPVFQVGYKNNLIVYMYRLLKFET